MVTIPTGSHNVCYGREFHPAHACVWNQVYRLRIILRGDDRAGFGLCRSTYRTGVLPKMLQSLRHSTEAFQSSLLFGWSEVRMTSSGSAPHTKSIVRIAEPLR